MALEWLSAASRPGAESENSGTCEVLARVAVGARSTSSGFWRSSLVQRPEFRLCSDCPSCSGVNVLFREKKEL